MRRTKRKVAIADWSPMDKPVCSTPTTDDSAASQASFYADSALKLSPIQKNAEESSSKRFATYRRHRPSPLTSAENRKTDDFPKENPAKRSLSFGDSFYGDDEKEKDQSRMSMKSKPVRSYLDRQAWERQQEKENDVHRLRKQRRRRPKKTVEDREKEEEQQKKEVEELLARKRKEFSKIAEYQLIIEKR
eukprot:m.310103 g.310103  ORF g.310103 m.310103 type:complete len:190 (+) comp49552_c0_seq1:96-665(+)